MKQPFNILPIGFHLVWLLATLALGYLFVYGSDYALLLLTGFGLAFLLWVLRVGDRLTFGILELLFGAWLLINAIELGAGRGPFTSAFNAAFPRFDPHLIALQSYAAVFILSRSFDDVADGCSKCRLCTELVDTVRRWFS